jgi:hypothetical protein
MKASNAVKTSIEAIEARNSSAIKTAIAAFESQARRSVAREIKCGARRYALAPSLLETLHSGLSSASPRGLVRRVHLLIADEIAIPRRHCGFGGDMPLLCLRSAMLYGRWSRVVEHSHRARAA